MKPWSRSPNGPGDAVDSRSMEPDGLHRAAIRLQDRREDGDEYSAT